jgi:TfoX/Sxy family transcriptional regulator of competence genes
MSTSPATIDHFLDSLAPLALSARKMFGEYALYLDGKVVALVCDDRLFVRPTAGAIAILQDSPHVPPYPGARGHLDATELLDEPDALIQALCKVAKEVPAPKPKKPKAR